MTTGLQAAREVTRTRLAQGHVKATQGGTARLSPAPDLGKRKWLVARMGLQALQVRTWTLRFCRLCSPPPTSSALRSSAGQRVEGKRLVEGKGLLWLALGCSGT